MRRIFPSKGVDIFDLFKFNTCKYFIYCKCAMLCTMLRSPLCSSLISAARPTLTIPPLPPCLCPSFMELPTCLNAYRISNSIENHVRGGSRAANLPPVGVRWFRPVECSIRPSRCEQPSWGCGDMRRFLLAYKRRIKLAYELRSITRHSIIFDCCAKVFTMQSHSHTLEPLQKE